MNYVYLYIYMYRYRYICAKCAVLSRSVMSLATQWTVVHQAPLSIGVSRQEYWSGLPFPPLGIFLTQELNLCLLNWHVGSLPLAPPL